MSLKESSATALVRFTGFGFVLFNRARRRGEIAAVRDSKHTLNIRLQTPAYQDGADGDVIAYQDVATYEKLPKEGVEVEIKAHGRPPVEGFEIYHGGGFDRLGGADPRDFNWVVSMDGLHDGASLAPTKQRPHPLTNFYISKGTFYTHKLDTALFFEKVEKDAAGRATRREVFGNVAETVGVKIEADAVSFTIRVGGRDETHTLNRVEGLPHRILISNVDHSENAVYSDMADYYEYLASPDGRQFDLAPILDDEAGGAAGDSVNQKQFCHPVTTELQSVDDL